MSLSNLMKRYHEKTGRPALVNNQYQADFVERLAGLVDTLENRDVSTFIDRAKIEAEVKAPIVDGLTKIIQRMKEAM